MSQVPAVSEPTLAGKGARVGAHDFPLFLVQLEPIEWVDPPTTSRPHGPCRVEERRCLLVRAARLPLRRTLRTDA
jgi:hypothetical protein